MKKVCTTNSITHQMRDSFTSDQQIAQAQRKGRWFSVAFKSPGIGILMFAILLSCISFGAMAQSQVNGQITDQNNQPLPGAAVQEIGTSNGTVTENDGRFSLRLRNPGALLRISYQGYLEQEIDPAGRSNIQISMAENTVQLDNMVITATRSERDLENLPQKMVVVTRKEIESTIATDVTDVLKKTSGVDVIQYPGLLSGVGIRGFRPQFSGVNQRTLLLIDGRPAGATNLATIDMNNVERVEVLKGPASALYGAQAMGGVVNLITKKTTGKIGGQIYGGLGNFGRFEGGFSSGGSLTNQLDYDVTFRSFSQRDDFRLGDGNLFRNMFGGETATRILWTDAGRQEVEIKDDRGDGEVRPNTSYSSLSGSIRLGYHLNDNWRIDAKADRFVADGVNLPGDIEDGSQRPNVKDVDRYGGDIIVNGKIGEYNELTAKVFAATEGNTNYRTSVNDTTTIRSTYVSGDNKLKWIGAQIMDRFRIGDHFITGGIDYNRVEQDNVSYNDQGQPNPTYVQRPNFVQENTGFYLQGEINLLNERLNVTAGIRNEIINYDITGTDLFPSRSETNNVINPSLGINYQLTNHFYAHATFGTAFTPVGAFQIAGYDERSVDNNPNDGVDTVDVWVGNPDLKNQSSRTFDVGVRYMNNELGLSFDVTYFNTFFENNVINKVEQFPDELSENGNVIRNRNSSQNAQGTTLTGLEFDLSYAIGQSGFSVFVNGVYIISAEEIRDVYLQPTPLTLEMHNVADLNLNYGVSFEKFSWLSARLSGRYVGQRYDTDWSYYLSADNGFGAGDYADVRYPSFMVMDFTITGRVGKNSLSLMVGNLTDENYYEKRGFNLMGRNYMLRYALNF